MKFIADLHVHSKYSRATAKNSDLEHLYIAAQLKGITLIATGDFTHPAWFAEICEKLIPAEPGLFRLKDEIAQECDREIPPSCRSEVRFILETEISNIYKKNSATRKNHNLIYVPDFDTAKRLNAKLDAIGNIKSDGRPILGLDAKKLLEIMLECSPNAFLIPAHIWTPWFSVFGSKSGFDSLKECFEELSQEIFAVETGLSSDAPMNWRVSELDSRVLVSNSDSHSPGNLGRNANMFDTELSFDALRSALKSKDPKHCLGTLDMYPEEGKYHADGHRKCNLWLKPSESIRRGGVCPICEKPLTLGVLHRVEALADRPEGFVPDNAIACHHIIPLPEIFSEIFDSGVNSKTVNLPYRNTLELLGPELAILHDLEIGDIDRAGIPLLSEAIRRMRAGEIHISPGYDGEYGKILVFAPGEKHKLMGQHGLFAVSSKPAKKAKESPPIPSKAQKSMPKIKIREELNFEQKQAIEHCGSPLLIIAGPGAGKTKTLTHRIAYLIQQRHVLPENILAVTFTRRAAQEMKERLKPLLNDSPSPMVTTFHALCFQILKDQGYDEYSVIDDDERKSLISEAIRHAKSQGIRIDMKPDAISDLISTAKQQSDMALIQDISEIFQAYQTLLASEKVFDYDDLIFNVVNLLESDQKVREHYIHKFQHILVDEYQDINLGQYHLIRLLTSSDKELCVIGDPDQAIYGFRGSDVRYFQRFTEDYPNSKTIRLLKNYRSAETILEASHQLIRHHSLNPSEIRIYSGIEGVKTLGILETATEKAEAVAVGKLIENMIGGMSFHSIDFGKTDTHKTDRAFSDIAVLYRSHQQSAVIAEIFDNAGIPYQIASRESLYQQKGIAELLSLLKICENKGLLTDIQKIAKLNLSDRISEIQGKISDLSVAEKLKHLLQIREIAALISESSKREQALETVLKIAAVFGNHSKAFFDTLALETDPDALDFDAQKVSLMTLHAAKGLEFPVVFIVGCEDGFLPFERSEDIAEERRLLYVGMTRAKERLFFSYAKKRMIYGKMLKREISPFVKAIEDRLMTLEKSEARKSVSEKKTQMDLFG